MTSLNPEYFWYFAFRISLFWKFWKYHLKINFAWFTSQSWFYPESEIILKIKTCLFLNFEIKMSKIGQKIGTAIATEWFLYWYIQVPIWLGDQKLRCDWLRCQQKRHLSESLKENQYENTVSSTVYCWFQSKYPKTLEIFLFLSVSCLFTQMFL